MDSLPFYHPLKVEQALQKDNIYTFSDFATGGCKGMLEGDTWMCIGIGQPSASVYTCAPERLTDGTLPTGP
jgi:hypothetical protein